MNYLTYFAVVIFAAVIGAIVRSFYDNQDDYSPKTKITYIVVPGVILVVLSLIPLWTGKVIIRTEPPKADYSFPEERCPRCGTTDFKTLFFD